MWITGAQWLRSWVLLCCMILCARQCCSVRIPSMVSVPRSRLCCQRIPLVVGRNSSTLVALGKSPQPASLVSKLSPAGSKVAEKLSFFQTMIAGALSRTVAQTLLHPAYTYKTILQLQHTDMVGIKSKLTFKRLLQGVDAQFLMSLPHGAFQFFVVDRVKHVLSRYMPARLDFLSDFVSSAVSTVICSIISTPQMVLTDRLMAGVYPTFPVALSSIMATDGVGGFYRGWWPALAQKIPSYGLTWMFFQQLKRAYKSIFSRKPNNEENFFLGALAAAGSVIVMVPMDTIKTRIVVQTANSPAVYRGVTDCFLRICREEGIGTFYRSLPPRLIAVVPMIALQFGIYEAMKSQFVKYNNRRVAMQVPQLAGEQVEPSSLGSRRILLKLPNVQSVEVVKPHFK